jgi:hypothetical protein
MRLLEKLKDYDDNIAVALRAMVSDVMGMELDDEQARTIVNNMGLSDVLAIDSALEKDDSDTIQTLITKHLGDGNA